VATRPHCWREAGLQQQQQQQPQHPGSDATVAFTEMRSCSPTNCDEIVTPEYCDERVCLSVSLSVSDVQSKRICSGDTNAQSALGVLTKMCCINLRTLSLTHSLTLYRPISGTARPNFTNFSVRVMLMVVARSYSAGVGMPYE